MPRLSKIGAAALGAFGWTSGASGVTASYLVVAGGGGASWAGGGGAGGYRTDSISLNPTLSYTVTVGAGGAQAVSGVGNNGSDSVFSTITSSGGGYGRYNVSAVSAGSGGSGGGIGGQAGTQTAGSGNTPSTSPSQGNNGGTGSGSGGGGGGGASAVGQSIASTTGGNGGAGTASSITGTSVTYAGGGGGGGSGAGGTGGAGGGGAGSTTVGTAGTANLGGGGGGGWNTNGGNGGSGVVIISYPSPQQFGGGIVTSVGGNTIHTFNTSGTLAPLSSLTASYLIVAGGGAGGGQIGGGGGAGGYQTGSGTTIDTNSIYVITVGAGGSGTTTTGGSGTNSSFSAYATASVGGGGGGSSNGNTAPTSGGSGGGSGGFSALSGGAGTAGQGNAGGIGNFAGQGGAPNYPGGGGGGASTAGANSPSGTVPGSGGTGTASSISGTSTTYASGGTGGLYNTGNINGVAGTANTGNGGAGAYANGATGTIGGTGGSGIVIITYAGSTQLMAGGTVTISGGNVIHTFTSSGYLTPLKLVNNSLRFRSSASAYLNRTPASAGSLTTWTFSCWIKRGLLGVAIPPIIVGNDVAGNWTYIGFSTDAILFSDASGGASTGSLQSTQVLRDPAAWYHLVFTWNTTQATASNRMKMYVNGSQVTAFSTATYPSQNAVSFLNSNVVTKIGSWTTGATNFDGYMTEVNFIDGQALTPNSFGTFNSYGVWQPITYGGSYGTNGFYLPFTATQSYTGIFSGSSQWVSVPNLAAYNVGTSNYTVEGWFYFNTISSQGLFGCDNGSGSTPKFVGLINSSGAILLEFTTAGGATFLTSSSGVVTTGKWYHIAWVRNSGTSTIYVNGTSVGSTATSVNLTGLTQAWNIGYIGEAGPSSLNGYASNFRLVTGTAVYTANFTPQTTALTAISGTQILTLQNATLVDNSTNAQTVTNTGGVTTGATYPFAYIGGTVKDFGSAGNNWTANNIGFTTGSTLDEMTDVPTLTSATAANYCTLNPIGTTSTLANGNLQYSGGTTFASSTMFPTSGLFYAEVVASGSFAAQGIAWGFASGKAQFPNTANPGASAINGTWFVYSGGGLLGTWIDTASGSNYANPFSVGSTWQLAIDATNGYVWLGQNNTWYSSLFLGTGNPATGANPTFTISSISTRNGIGVLCGLNTTGGTFTWNFGQQPFTYTPPTNFVALNTYNL
jgi:hypothetical protein